MGYYTKYKIETDRETTEFEKDELDAGTVEELISKDIGFDPFDDECKWYDFSEDMVRFSKKYTSVLFKLTGEGEKSGDMWRCYFLDGKSQFCKAIITYDEFDESKIA